MANDNHTPGPWLGFADALGLFAITADGGHKQICEFAERPSEADGDLMIAGPDMLAALREAARQLQYLADKFGETGTGPVVLARVNAAIAKAIGEHEARG